MAILDPQAVVNDEAVLLGGAQQHLSLIQSKSFTLISSDSDLSFKESFKLPQNGLVIILITYVSRNNTHSVNSGSQNVFFNCSEEKNSEQFNSLNTS